MYAAEQRRNVAVVGAGWAGCAAAVELSLSGHRVTLLEAGRTPGGRARRATLQGLNLDNGQHILLGAYSESLRLMRAVGVDPDAAMLRLPLQMRYPPESGGMDFSAARLPSPLHLMAGLMLAGGLARADKLALMRFFSAARWMGWILHNDCTVAQLMERFDQTARINELLWRPLCIAALNTPLERASAKVFLAVLRDSLGSSRRGASDMLLPRADLSALFPEPAAALVERKGGAVLYGCNVRALQRHDAGWRIDTVVPAAGEVFDAVVVATSSVQAAGLLAPFKNADGLAALGHEPIATCYLQYDADVRLAQPFYALRDDFDAGSWGQFVFDRGQLFADQAGLLAVVISTASAAERTDRDALQAAVAAQLARDLRRPELASPLWSRLIMERRATFFCSPALARPGNDTGIPGLVLAGDYTESEYPATLEAAVRSGVSAARLTAAREQ